jgi:hypothetical protein
MNKLDQIARKDFDEPCRVVLANFSKIVEKTCVENFAKYLCKADLVSPEVVARDHSELKTGYFEYDQSQQQLQIDVPGINRLDDISFGCNPATGHNPEVDISISKICKIDEKELFLQRV